MDVRGRYRILGHKSSNKKTVNILCQITKLAWQYPRNVCQTEKKEAFAILAHSKHSFFPVAPRLTLSLSGQLTPQNEFSFIIIFLHDEGPRSGHLIIIWLLSIPAHLIFFLSSFLKNPS